MLGFRFWWAARCRLWNSFGGMFKSDSMAHACRHAGTFEELNLKVSPGGSDAFPYLAVDGRRRNSGWALFQHGQAFSAVLTPSASRTLSAKIRS